MPMRSDASPQSNDERSPFERVIREATEPSSSLVLFGLLALVCLAIYLPGLGTAELKGEEERRILPALDMMRTGDWAQPMLGGEPYHTKPPLINWIVAASFMVTGVVNEWTARLPSVLAMIGFLGMLSFLPCASLSRRARLFAGLVFLTNVGMWEKGRLIEIEAILIAINGAACLWWFAARLNGWSAWKTWLVPCSLLAAGFLLKGPAMPVFFYGFVGCVVLSERRLRDLFHPAHLVGFAGAAACFGAWYLLSAKQESHAEVSHGLLHEAFARFVMFAPSFGNWLRIGLLSFVNFLPWIAFVPMWWRREAFDGLDDRARQVFAGARWGILIPFVLIAFLPGTSARYSMPVFPMASMLLGFAFDRLQSQPAEARLGRFAIIGGLAVLAVLNVVGWAVLAPTVAGAVVVAIAAAVAVVAFRERTGFENRAQRLWGTAAIAVVAALGYAAFATELLAQRERYRPTAAAMNELVPEGHTLTLFDPGEQEFLFYVERPLAYAFAPEELNGVDYLAIRRADLETVVASESFRGVQVEELYEVTPRIEGEFRLVRLSPVAVSSADDAVRE